ncbi:MAG TPA: PAS domain-containing protein [Myxococcota bacterium]|nr:PAS domain-containing protein [Myxococcota bacterium]HRY94520.1 PAS domain-containing protein [Myxococcota bacterium]HSA20019.1 PAS domain-containing protein [Myxococcota bacterium]
MKDSQAPVGFDFLVRILEALPHPFYVIKADDYTIVLANAAARLGALTGETTCHALTHHSPTPCEGDHPCPVRLIRETRQPVVVEHTHFDADGQPRTIEVHAFPILDAAGQLTHIIECGMDISTRRQAELERQAVLERLERALEQVKQLSGLLPICAACKKIRDPEGGWRQLEAYIRDHSEADFSHTLCPACADRLYPKKGS